MSAVDSSSDKYSKCPTFRPLDFDNSLKELRSYCLGGKPLCLVSTLPDPVTMYVHARSAAVNALAAAGALQDPQYQLAPGPAQDVAPQASAPGFYPSRPPLTYVLRSVSCHIFSIPADSD